MINGKHGQGTTVPKWVLIHSLAQFVWDFQKKLSLGVRSLWVKVIQKTNKIPPFKLFIFGLFDSLIGAEIKCIVPA